MICLIDNYDSFTYNIVHLLEKIGEDVVVLKNDSTIYDIDNLNPAKIIISPGPGSPNESGICFEVIDIFKDKLPILGICLGHQIIGQYFGCKIGHAGYVMHGKRVAISHNGNGIFEGIVEDLFVARYHSLAIKEISESIEICARDRKDEEIMAIKHQYLPIFGVQFHPESFLSENGDILLRNFCKV
ncbi:anthranilate synthase component II [Candidatus Deianiraea vastatrix]|uniref:Aminodeoxychorismate synthase component 2 n=1 Tax=Candidatus Deianiraea vastatrix TaxID=2163644 RepID=A0A5B8XFX5_9RICK|nr:aminodeoxychorismate/anthranilate synthase component II [Candidatus Deianiraea vastatrix]QED23819.1 Aminodeoxychorismate synthase component 2 [Candidatus Deianiraea vastatrix]